jgi:hypothetical protein
MGVPIGLGTARGAAPFVPPHLVSAILGEHPHVSRAEALLRVARYDPIGKRRLACIEDLQAALDGGGWSRRSAADAEAAAAAEREWEASAAPALRAEAAGEGRNVVRTRLRYTAPGYSYVVGGYAHVAVGPGGSAEGLVAAARPGPGEPNEGPAAPHEVLAMQAQLRAAGQARGVLARRLPDGSARLTEVAALGEAEWEARVHRPLREAMAAWRALAGDDLEALWREATGNALPIEVRRISATCSAPAREQGQLQSAAVPAVGA